MWRDRDVNFGVHLPNSGPFASCESIHRIALATEALGFDAVCVHDHVNWGHSDKYHFYAGSVEEADAAEFPFSFLSAPATLAYVAGVTNRIRLVPAALCLAWRHPLYLAREAVTLHEFAQGRFVLCVTVGNVKRDFEVTGVPWEQRGRIGGEHLKALRLFLDSTGPVSFEGRHTRFQDAEIYPHPTGLKMWYGGTSEVAIRRAAKYCEGWMPAGGPEYFRAKIPELRRYAEIYGRESVGFELAVVCRSCIATTYEDAVARSRQTLESELKAEWLTRHDIPDIRTTWLVGPSESIAERIHEFEQAGVTLIFLSIIADSVTAMIEQMEAFAKHVVPMVRRDKPGQT
jgi:alkanesulfonate monooxygenase SsuD/methylene tetrahydromethanopterin reductase-like flavin-dependent oxidoreductase (luciferase family)